MYSMPHRLENCKSIELPNPAKWTLQGHSKAGERTGFWIKQLKVVLDAGLSTYQSPKAIFLTHSHTDHSFEVTHIYEGREKAILKGKGKGKGKNHKIDERGRPIVMQQCCVPLIEKLINCTNDLSSGTPDYCIVNGIDPWYHRASYPFLVEPTSSPSSSRYTIDSLQDIEIEVLEGFHSVPSVGYGFNTVTHKLKPELLELVKTDKNKFIELKQQYEKEGKSTTTRNVVPQMVYYGDTNIRALIEREHWKKYPVVVIECTLFADKTRISPRQMDEHIHWDDIREVMSQHSNNHFVLIHTSMSVDDQFLMDLERTEKSKDDGVHNFQFMTDKY